MLRRFRIINKSTSLFIIIISALFVLAGCNSGGGEGVDSFLQNSPDGGTDSGDTDTPQVGNAAITFNPASYDFGSHAITTGSSSNIINLTNSSNNDLYIDSISGTTGDFTITTNNCPTGTSALAAGANCQLNIEFSPQQSGSLSTTLIAKYGTSANGDNFNSLIGLSGTGVGQIDFEGISSFDQITNKSARVNWPLEAQATSFMVFSVSGGAATFIKTVVNTGGTVQSTILTGLSPNTIKTYRVNAVDSLGNLDGNTKDVALTTAVNLAPALAAINPGTFYSGETLADINANDSNTSGDTDQDGDTITYTCRYDKDINTSVGTGNGLCTSLANEGGGNPTFNTSTGLLSGWSPLHSEVGDEYEFEIIASDPYGGTSSRIFSGTVTAGTPPTPVVTGVTPSGSANNNSPVVSGTAEANITVNVYSDSSCNTLVGSGSANAAGNFSVTTTINNDTAYTFYARTRNVIGNDSSCSATSVAFTEDSTGPSSFISNTTPATQSSLTTFTVEGITEANATVKIYSDSDCDTEVSSGSATAGGSFSVSTTIAADATLTYYAQATDTNGNVGTCSTTNATYTNYTIADGIAYFASTETSNGNKIVNPSSVADIRWNDTSHFDFNYYSHSLSSNNHEITLKQAGRYLVAVTLPATMASGTERPAFEVEALIGSTAIKGAHGETTYIRDSSGHLESSAHFTVLTDLVTADSKLKLTVKGTAGEGGDEIVELSNQAVLYVEFIAADRKVFHASGTDTTTGSDLNELKAPMIWDQHYLSSGFSHTTPSEDVTLENGGTYLAYFNIPINSTVQRASIRAFPEIGSSEQLGAEAMQGYIRGFSSHTNSSVHYAGLISGVAASSNFELMVEQIATAGTVQTQTSKVASLVLEEVDPTNNMISLSATQITGGAPDNWNPAGEESINWTSVTNSIDDAAVFGHDTGSNPHQIQIKQRGDYLLLFNASFSSTVQRAAPRIKVKLGGNLIKGGEVKTAYIRSGSAHEDSSASMTILLRDVPANEILTITIQEEAVSGQVDDSKPAVLTIIKK